MLVLSHIISCQFTRKAKSKLSSSTKGDRVPMVAVSVGLSYFGPPSPCKSCSPRRARPLISRVKSCASSVKRGGACSVSNSSKANACPGLSAAAKQKAKKQGKMRDFMRPQKHNAGSLACLPRSKLNPYAGIIRTGSTGHSQAPYGCRPVSVRLFSIFCGNVKPLTSHHKCWSGDTPDIQIRIILK